MAQENVMKVWVVGASNVDIIARSAAPLVAADSNIGTVEKASGGVGRNIGPASGTHRGTSRGRTPGGAA